jgi:hypothetical protein
LHDSLQFERLGVPATLVMTEPFQGLAANFAANLGAPGYPSITVPHPIATRDDAALDAIADQVADDLVARLAGS